MKHTELWHRSRDRWSCPTLTHTTDPNLFFDTDEDADGNTTDFCLCCGREEHLREKHLREKHLREKHHFGECGCWENCFSAEQFCLHLANFHNIAAEYVKDFVSSCKTVGRAPALMAQDLHQPVDR
jgi:hypothetical protein